MVLFSTKFALSKHLTFPIFLEMLSNWLNSMDCGLTVDYDLKSAEYVISDEDKLAVLSIYKTECHLAVQFTQKNLDANEVYVYTYVMTIEDGCPILFVRVENQLCTISVKALGGFKIPTLLQDLFWQEYVGEDHGLPTDNKSFLLRKIHVALAVGILTNTQVFFNPIVYISSTDNGNYVVNYERLASELLGLAHVVVESNPYVAGLIDDASGGKNPKHGDVQVLLPTGECYTFHMKSNLYSSIRDYILRATTNLVVDDNVSFQKVRLQALFGQYEMDKELSSLCDSLLSERDLEVAQLSEELSDAKQQIQQLSSQVEHYKGSFQKVKDNADTNGVVLKITESDLYEHEISDVLLKLIKKEHDSMDADVSLRGSRKYHILSSLLEQNELTHTDEEIRQIFSESVKSGALAGNSINLLTRNGFQINNTKTHYKVIYREDSRYQFSISKSPSDFRAGENLVTQYMNTLFGY